MLLELALGVFSVKRANQWPISLKNSTQPSSNTAPLVSQPGTTAVRGGEGRERSTNFGINSREKSPVQNKKRSPLRFSLNSNKTEIGKGSDLRDSRWTGRGLIVELAKNGKR